MNLNAQGSFSFQESPEGPSQPEPSRGEPGPSEGRPSFYILDAFSLIFQVFHAIPEMTGPAGQPTQAVFGIFRDLLNLFKDRKPDYLAAAFDGVGPGVPLGDLSRIQGQPHRRCRRTWCRRSP